MGETTLISWTDHTFNPWIGCSKVSAGCTNCYAEELMDKRYGRVHWGKGQKRDRTSPENWKKPIRWNAKGPGRVFCASLADWLDDEVDANWLGDLLELIDATPNLTWQLLTKRPENWESRLAIVQGISHDANNRAAMVAKKWLAGNPPPNVWIGVSAEDQVNYDWRVPQLFRIPAGIRFVSAEPLLGPIKISSIGVPIPDWIIAGGESGDGARECRVEWIEDLVWQCRGWDVDPFVKQLGSNATYEHEAGSSKGGCRMPMSLKHKKGGDPEEWPIDLRVQEFPI